MLQVQPQELEYAFQRPYYLIVQPAALAAGTNDVIILTVPLNEVWELHGASISTVVGAVSGATVSLSSALTGASFDTQVIHGPQVLSVLNAQRDLLAAKVGIIIPPGSDIRLHIEAALVNDVVAVRLLVYKFPRFYFSKPIG